MRDRLPRSKRGLRPAAPLIALLVTLTVALPRAVSAQTAASMSDMSTMPGMKMGPMQGGGPPPDARSPDYSEGVGYGSMKGMDMADDTLFGRLLLDQLEQFHSDDANGQFWEAEAWYGNDRDKAWLRTEGERRSGTLESADLEAFWNHTVGAFWSTQLGVRQDFDTGPKRTWAALGVEALVPYWLDVEATAYAASSGRTAARLRAEYELLFTQRLILQSEGEINLYGRSDPERHLGRGLSDVQIALRLRYEIHREFAPYLGVSWIRLTGATADFARQDRQAVVEWQALAGVRMWF